MSVKSRDATAQNSTIANIFRPDNGHVHSQKILIRYCEKQLRKMQKKSIFHRVTDEGWIYRVAPNIVIFDVAMF